MYYVRMYMYLCILHKYKAYVSCVASQEHVHTAHTVAYTSTEYTQRKYVRI